jgi:hypothetical protein
VIGPLASSPILFPRACHRESNDPPARFSHRDHFLRPPAWRWLRAVDLADNRHQPSPEEDDDWVSQALRFYYPGRKDSHVGRLS